MKKIFIFPGQGNQNSQMLKPLLGYKIPEVEKIFQEASEICGFDLLYLISYSPADVLNRTEYTQIIMFVTEIAYLKVLEHLKIYPDMVAGHSIGEYAALVSAGVMDFPQACNLVKNRARLMSEVKISGGLCLLKGKEVDVSWVEKLCQEIANETGYVAPALYNSKSQIVIGGEKKALEEFERKLKMYPEYFTKRLAVGQAFHTKLMKTMSEEYFSFVEKIEFQNPQIPILLNCTAQMLLKEEQLKQELVEQCFFPVQWQRIMEKFLEEENPVFIEVGPGHSLTSLMKNYRVGIPCICTEDRKEILKIGKE